jgi:hypothetical protein
MSHEPTPSRRGRGRAGALHAQARYRLQPDTFDLILTHGWPWTFWHWSKVIDPPADPGAYGSDPAEAFDVIIPRYPASGSPPRWRATRT